MKAKLTTAAMIVVGAAALAMIFAPPARAQDSWTGPDKTVHFAVSAVLGVAAINQWPDRPMLAWGVAMVPGILKEVSDRSTTGFSGKDLAANALGAAVGWTSAAGSSSASAGPRSSATASPPTCFDRSAP